MSELLQDLKFGWRTLRKSPGFTAVALATLGIGIGANTAIFSFVNGMFLRPLPYAYPERIVRLRDRQPSGERDATSTLAYLDWAQQATVFDVIAADTGWPVTLTGRDEPVRVWGWKVSAHYFDVFGVKPFLGRTFVEGEDQAGNDHVAVMSFKFWKSSFGGDSSVIGRTVQFDGEPYTIIGVLPPGQAFSGDLWRPLYFTPGNQNRDYRWMEAMARLKPGVTLAQARAQMDTIALRLAQDYPATNQGWGISVEPLMSFLVGAPLRQSLYVLLAAVSMVLLIACANLANLTLARGLAREREVAIRVSLGAGRWRLIRQLLTESVLLSVGGGVLGIALGYAGMVVLAQRMPLSMGSSVTMDWRVLLFTAGLTVLTGVLCGLVPALQATQPNLAASTKRGGHGTSAGGARYRLRDILVVAEVALAFVLLMGAGLVIRSFSALQKMDLGIDATNVVTAELPIPPGRITEAAGLTTYLRQLSENIGALPGVRDVAFTSALPMRGWGYGLPFRIVGGKDVNYANRPICFFKMVSPSYFHALGIRLLRGRLLEDRDRKGTLPVALINARMAKKYFGTGDPLGKQILVQELILGKAQLGPEIPWEVVGVIADEKISRPGEKEDDSGMYVTVEQSPQLSQSLVVRGAMDPVLLQKSIQQAVHHVNKDQPLPFLKTIEQIKSDAMGDKPLRSTLLTIFAGVALLLAAIGIYGVISYSVAQRTREIGIRTALGATPGNILKLVLHGGMRLVISGLVIGIVAAFGLMRLLSSLLYGVTEHDPFTMTVTAAILAGVALVACLLPARRATKVNPVVALRSE